MFDLNSFLYGLFVGFLTFIAASILIRWRPRRPSPRGKDGDHHN